MLLQKKKKERKKQMQFWNALTEVLYARWIRSADNTTLLGTA